ncbi:MAG TPA: polysaccharide deacetylase family protein [Candidatus Dormibacteraeota bacterium]
MHLLAAAAIATILCYHEVDPLQDAHVTVPRASATTSGSAEMLRYTAAPENFTAQLDYLEQNGYTVIPLERLVDCLEGQGEALPPRAVVITVDDGWLCAYTRIAPELRRRGMPFTLFVYPHIVGRGEHAVSWPQVEELAGEGVDVESHTLTHPFLTQLDPVAVDRELAESREEIERHTHEPVRFLSYPYGDYNPAVMESAQRSGYDAAVTTWRGPITAETPPLELKRYLIHNDTTLDELKTFLP